MEKLLGLSHRYLHKVTLEHSKFNKLFHSLNVIECTLGCQYINVHYTCYKLYPSGKPLSETELTLE